MLDDLIDGPNTVVIGVGSGWQNYNADGTLTEDDFTDASGGITVGDNGTEQVIVLSCSATHHGTPVTTLCPRTDPRPAGRLQHPGRQPRWGRHREEEADADQVENQGPEKLPQPDEYAPERPRPMMPSTRPTPTSAGSTTCRKETSP